MSRVNVLHQLAQVMSSSFRNLASSASFSRKIGIGNLIELQRFHFRIGLQRNVSASGGTCDKPKGVTHHRMVFILLRCTKVYEPF